MSVLKVQILNFWLSNYVEKKYDYFLFNFFITKKTTFVFSLENIPYFTFLQNMIVLSLCWFITSWALHIISIANITKQLRILYQNSKFVLNFATTMPQIVNITQICCLLTKLQISRGTFGTNYTVIFNPV